MLKQERTRMTRAVFLAQFIRVGRYHIYMHMNEVVRYMPCEKPKEGMRALLDSHNLPISRKARCLCCAGVTGF